MELSTIPSQLLPLGCMRDYGSSTVQVHGGLRDRDKARRRSTPVGRVDMTKRSSAARCLSLRSPVISHTLGELPPAIIHPRAMTAWRDWAVVSAARCLVSALSCLPLLVFVSSIIAL